MAEQRKKKNIQETDCSQKPQPVGRVDTNQLKKAEEALRESEDRFAKAFHSSPIALGIARLDDGTIVDANESFEHLSGFNRQELIGQNTLELNAFTDPDQLHEMHRIILGGGKIRNREITVRNKDGKLLTTLISSEIIQVSKERMLLTTIVDISERKQAEEALAKAKHGLELRVQERTSELSQSEEKFRRIFETSNEAIWIVDLKGNILVANDQVSKILGYPLEEIIGRPTSDFLIKGQEHHIVVRMRKALSKGVKLTYERRLRHKNGSTVYLLVKSSPLSDSEGRHIANIGMMSDVTERKKAEEALKASQRKYQALTETTSDFIWETDAQGRYTYCSPQMKTLWGYDPQERIGKTPFDALLPEEREWGNQYFKAMAQAQSPFSGIELNSLDSQGRRIMIEISGVPYFDNDGKFSGFRGVTRDITERKKAEDALRKSEEKYRLLVDNSREAIAVVQDGLIKFMNKKGLDLTGYSPEEIVGKPFFEVAHPEDRELVSETHRRAIAGQAAADNFEFRVVSKDRSTWWVLMKEAKITWEERPAILALFNDITKRKQAQEALRESEAKANDLIKYAPTGIYEIDMRSRRLISVNDVMCSVTGYTREELLAMNPIELLDENSRKLFAERVKSNLAAKRVDGTVDYRVRKKDGTFIDVTLYTKYSSKEPNFILVIAHDVTERKLAEEAVRLSEEKYRLVVENASEAIVIAQDGMLQYSNPRLLEISGYSADEVKSKPFLSFIHPEDRKQVAEIYQRRINGQAAPATYEYRIIHKDGSARWMRMNAALITWQGRPATLNIFYDITQEKNLKDQLVEYAHRITQVQEEERKRIAYELHDDTAQYLSILKMQLGALISSSQIQSPEVKKKLEYLEQDADRAFNDVRRYSHELRPVVLEHMGLLASLEQIAEDYNKVGQVSVEVSVEGPEPELSEEVKLGFFRIAQEALNNVRKHAKASKAAIDLKYKENRVRMAVSDNGVGFDIQESTSRSKGKGSLGLMSMQERAKLIGAELKIKSQPGHGTTVTAEISLEDLAGHVSQV